MVETTVLTRSKGEGLTARRMATVNVPRRGEAGMGLGALLPASLDRAFKGEL